jgi:pSer/pThr/pTyr-binding forkhead associated (FHA) protein
MFMAPDFLDATKVYVAERIDETSAPPSKDTREERKPIFGWLVVIEGADAWKVFTLPNEEAQIFLGTGKECMLRFDDAALEARHTSIRIKENNIYVTDLDTTTGTTINGECITRVNLQDGDIIKASTIALKFKRF